MRAYAAACIAALLVGTPSVHAQPYPSKPVRMIFPFAAGGPLDGLLRAVTDKLATRLGQPFILESRPGAGGNIGAEAAARAAADGYTLLATIDTTFTVSPYVYAKVPFRLDDFRALVTLSTNGSMLVVHPGLNVKAVGELVVRLKNDALAYSSAGIGSPGHLGGELFLHTVGARATHVPYKGNLPAVTDLVSGQVQFGVLGTAGIAPHLASGKLIGLGVTSRTRSPLAPSVPTLAEQGHADLHIEFGQVILAPRQTPDAIAETLRAALVAAVADPEVRARMAAGDYQPRGDGPAETVARIRADAERWRAVVRAAGIRAD